MLLTLRNCRGGVNGAGAGGASPSGVVDRRWPGETMLGLNRLTDRAPGPLLKIWQNVHLLTKM